jgi:hypothetical protein
MARHLNLRDNGDISVCSISHQLTCLSLCEVSARSTLRALLNVLAVAIPPTLPVVRRAPSSKAREAWIALNLKAPACRIGKVQMEAIHLEACHHIYLTLKEIDSAEVA